MKNPSAQAESRTVIHGKFAPLCAPPDDGRIAIFGIHNDISGKAASRTNRQSVNLGSRAASLRPTAETSRAAMNENVRSAIIFRCSESFSGLAVDQFSALSSWSFGSSRAATSFSGLPSKNVAINCFKAERFARFSGTVGS